MALLAGCASSTSVTVAPSPQPPICAPAAQALVLWAPQWRANQKDVPAREAAAQDGLRRFLSEAGCFAQATLRRVESLAPAAVQAQVAGEPGRFSALVGVEVRELGPVVKLLSSAALVEGGTEVVLRIVDYAPATGAEQRQFTVHWRSGGAGVVKGVASLPADMQAALSAGLQPPAATR